MYKTTKLPPALPLRLRCGGCAPMAETWPEVFRVDHKDLPYDHCRRIAVCGLPLADRKEPRQCEGGLGEDRPRPCSRSSGIDYRATRPMVAASTP
jgi:hypothetical protein